MTENIPQPPQRRLVCIPIMRHELGLLASSWLSVVNNTTADTEILLLAVGFDPALLQDIPPPSERIGIAQAPYEDPWGGALRSLPPGYRRHDLLLLRPGIEVPLDWDARLALSAYRQPGIAATVPMCDSTPSLALLPDRTPDRIALQRLDPLLLNHSPRHDPEIPALFSGCAYLRRAALDAIESAIPAQPRMTPGDWCYWLARAFREQGWNTILCDHVYVLDHAPERCRHEMTVIERLEEVQLLARAHPLSRLRSTMKKLLSEDAVAHPPRNLPVQLHIAHSWGGGLNHWVAQYCKNDRIRRNLVLRATGPWGVFGQRIALYRSSAMDRPLRYWDLDYPIRATALAHVEYRAILREIVAEFGVEAILVSSLIGHALDVLATGLPTVMIAHDYYPFCPAIVIRFGEVCESCEPERLARCFAENEHNVFFRDIAPSDWLSLRRRFAQLMANESIAFVAPSPSVVRHWQTLMPELQGRSFKVIPHGLDFRPARLFAPFARKPLRIVILGSLAPQKGHALLERLWPLIADQVELYLIGCDRSGESFRHWAGITVIPRYQHDELAALLEKIQPELGLLLSVCAETFSYALSELWLMGLPVVATNLGSFADRIEHGVNGFLCPPQAEAIAARLLSIAADRTCLQTIRANLADFRHRSVAEMIADYHALLPVSEFSASRYLIAASLADSLTLVQTPKTLHIDAQAPFGQVLREFGEYVNRKLLDTPRLKSWQKRSLTSVFGWIQDAARMLGRMRSRA